MDFQNDSSINMLPLQFLDVLMVIKLPHCLQKFFFSIPDAILSAIEIFKMAYHISARYLHRIPSDDTFSSFSPYST